MFGVMVEHRGSAAVHKTVTKLADGRELIYYDAEPVVIDAGVETYTKKTFGPDRYEIWTMQSGYHNCPTINGYEQLPGPDRRATGVRFNASGDVTTLAMDLKEAYPAEAGVSRYVRVFAFKHGESLEITDDYALASCDKPLVLNLITYDEPSASGGRVGLGPVVMSYDSGEFDAAIEKITLTDASLLRDWGKDDIYRVLLTQKTTKKEGSHKVTFTKAH